MGVKGYYFSLDAFLGAAIIFLGIFLTSSIYTSDAETSQLTYTSRDIVSVLSELKISEVNNSYVSMLIAEGHITNTENSILEQMGEFWAANKTEEAMYLALNFTSPYVDENYGLGVFANDETLFQTAQPSDALISSKKLITGIAQEKPTEGYSSRALLSQLTGKTIYSYSYFGGYVGEGDIISKISLNTFDTIQEAYFEGVVNDSFTIYINGIYSGTYSDKVAALNRADTYLINETYFDNFKPGINEIAFEFNTTKFIGGGFFRVSYNISGFNYSSPEYDGTYITKKEYINGIDGVVNLFSSFYVPGELESITLYINYTSNYPFFVNFGNDLIYDNNMSSQQVINITIPNSVIESKLDYPALSKKTVPVRIGHYDVSKFPNLSRTSDVIIATDVTSSMDTEDIPDAPNQSRLEVAKFVEKDFSSYVLSANIGNNRIGLVGYHSTTSASRALDLTSDNETVQIKIDSYSTVGGDNTCFSCALIEARDQLTTLSNSSKKRAIVIMSDGQTNRCYNSPTNCGIAQAKAESVSIACSIFGNYSISIYAIGFGSGADNATLRNISENCSDGKYYHSNNQSSLDEAFNEIADEILTLEFKYQQTISDGVYSAIYPSSYIELVYEPAISPLTFGQIPITVETAAFGNSQSSGSVLIPQNATLYDFIVTSYSGNYWTSNLSINNGSWNTVYNLDEFGTDYPVLGDPYSVHVSPDIIPAGNTSIIISTGFSSVNKSGGSPDNKAIYTILVTNAISSSGVYEKAEGCTWFVNFEDTTSGVFTIPATYNGTGQCYFENESYDSLDAINIAIYGLLNQLDLDNDGQLEVNLNEQSFTLQTSTQSKVPSLWGPSTIEVRVWQ